MSSEDREICPTGYLFVFPRFGASIRSDDFFAVNKALPEPSVHAAQ
jgi:hypothetical protein